MTNRVFFPVSNHRFGVVGASNFGEIAYIFGDDHPSPLDVQRTVDAMDAALQAANYNPNEDYVALTGPTILVALLLSTALSWIGEVNVLVFDAPNHRYLGKKMTVAA